MTPVYRPPATQERRDTRAQGREAAKPKPKTSKPKPEQKVTQAAAPALPGLSREEATSPDTMLLAGGLALFVLVLADMVFLTLSTRVMRAR